MSVAIWKCFVYHFVPDRLCIDPPSTITLSVPAFPQHLNQKRSFTPTMNERFPTCPESLHARRLSSSVFSCVWLFLNTLPVSVVTRGLAPSVYRPARGVFLHHDGHAAVRGSAHLQRTDQTSGGGRGSGAGSGVRGPPDNTSSFSVTGE